MKQYLIVLSLMLTLGLVSADAKPKHRHHQPAPPSTVVTPSAQAVPDSTANDEVVAFSDTTSIAGVDDSDFWDDEDVSLSPDDYDDPFSWFDAVFTHKKETVGAMIGLVVVILFLCFFFLLLPLIIVILLLRYLVKRHNRNIDMRQQRMANAASTQGPPPAPDAAMGPDAQGPDMGTVPPVSEKDEMWQRGIKNTSIDRIVYGLKNFKTHEKQIFDVSALFFLNSALDSLIKANIPINKDLIKSMLEMGGD